MEERIGTVIHFYDKISVAVIRLEKDLAAGDMIHVQGKAEDFSQRVDSMQVDHEQVSSASTGQEVALKTDQKAHEGDVVYRQ